MTYERTYIIDTHDPELAARWFAEHMPDLMSVNQALSSPQIEVWPETQAEHDSIGKVAAPLNRVTLLKLAESILKSLPED